MECEPVMTIWARDHNPETYILHSSTNFWEVLESNHKVEGVNIPDTVVYKEGQLWRWFFTAAKCNSKSVIMRKNTAALNIDAIVSHFASRYKTLKKHFSKYVKRMPEFLPFTPVCFSKNSVEKFNTFYNYKETETMLTSLLRTISYLQDFVPSQPHYDLFSSARFYCMFSEENGLGGSDRFKCFKEIIEYVDAGMNSDSQLYRENAVDAANVVNSEEKAFGLRVALHEELSRLNKWRTKSSVEEGHQKYGTRVTRTFPVCEDYIWAVLVKVC